jgi:hypothetical protein
MSQNNELSYVSGNSQGPLTAAALHEGVSRVDDRYVGRSHYDLSHFRYPVSAALEYGLYNRSRSRQPSDDWQDYDWAATYS